MKKETKTNAARLLDRAGIGYELQRYPVDEADLSAGHVAEVLGADPKVIYKTLVLRGERNGYFVCVIPGDAEVDLKKAARAFGDKKADLIPMKELLPLTGYVRGGCSPIGMKKQFPTWIDSRAGELSVIYISAGVRGVQIKLAPLDLVAFLGASVADLTQAEG